jgi:hypothetical protein
MDADVRRPINTRALKGVMTPVLLRVVQVLCGHATCFRLLPKRVSSTPAFSMCLYAALLVLSVSARATIDKGLPSAPLRQQAVRSAPPYLLWQPDNMPLPLELQRIEVGEEASAGSARIVRIDTNQPVRANMYWVATTALAKKTPVVMRATVANGRLTREEEALIGPGEGQPPWRPGSMYCSEVLLDLLSIGRSATGDGYLTICMLSKGVQGVELVPLLTFPVHIVPRQEHARFDSDMLRSAFGEEVELVDVSCRLGPGAVLARQIGGGTGAESTAVVLVSAFGYGDIPQDGLVAEVRLETEAGEEISLPVRSGVETARADYDYDPHKARHRRVRIVESRDAGYNDVRGRPFERHYYGAEIPLPLPSRVTALYIENVSEVVLDIFGIGLTRNSGTPR